MQYKEVLIIRHGRSEHNVRTTDDLDSRLTDWGHRQAAGVADFIKNRMDMGSCEYVTSPFLRCLQTSHPIQKVTGCEFRVEPLAGEYLNHCGKEVLIPNREEQFPLKGFWWGSYPSEGKVFREEFNEIFFNRILALYHSLADRSVVVTHGLPAMLLANIALGKLDGVPIYDHSLDNCSMTHIVNGRKIWWGRNLTPELDYDPLDKPRVYDKW